MPIGPLGKLTAYLSKRNSVFMIIIPLKFRSGSGHVCLTHEDLLVKWDNQDRQRKEKQPEQGDRQQEEQTIAITHTALNRMIAAAVAQALKTTPGVAPTLIPATTKKVNKRKKGPILFCNQFNKEAGCRRTPTKKGCIAPDGSQFRHGCSFPKKDGGHCNARDHNIHNHED